MRAGETRAEHTQGSVGSVRETLNLFGKTKQRLRSLSFLGTCLRDRIREPARSLAVWGVGSGDVM